MTNKIQYHFTRMDAAADAIDAFNRKGENFANPIWWQPKTDGTCFEHKVFREFYSIQEQDYLPP
jgi:hypothetical protein